MKAVLELRFAPSHERSAPPMSTSPTVSCPRCGAHVVWSPAARFRPFCSERCKMNDLGAWATEQYRVPDSSDPIDEDAEPGEKPS